MDTLRFVALAVGLFAAAFVGTKWLFTVHPLKPDARVPTFQRYDRDSPRAQLEQSSVSDNDATRDRLRNELLSDAKALDADPCNDALKAKYIKAANDYMRAWLAIAPCLKTQTCRNADWSSIELAGKAFGTPLDHRVREAVQQVHAKGVFKFGDFPNDTARMMAEFAADPGINPALVNQTTNGPVNAHNDQRPHPGIAEIRAQLGAPQPQICGG